MDELYGSDGLSFSSGAFVWASEMTVRVVAPAANLSGVYYKGAVPLATIE